VDAVAKDMSTSMFGNAVSLDESPLAEDLVYVGTDDGLVQVTEDGGANWRKVALFPEVPDMAYVSCLSASQHDADTVYASFDNHKNGDFKPYLLKSTDRGRNWEVISGDLPDREIVWTVKQDHVDANLLFVGTEFGLYFTKDSGKKWIRLKNGLPTIAVRDLEIQRRENDLVLGTFGRSFYVLDDYSPLRQASDEEFSKDAVLFPVKDALRYMETSRLGGRSGRGSQGATFYAAPNPPFGAIFTYYLKEKLATRKERRQEAEKKAQKAGKDVGYPSVEELRLEDEEKEPSIVLVVRDEAGEIVRRVSGSREKGIHRVAWDLRFPSSDPTVLKPPADLPPWVSEPVGPMALAGSYRVELAKEVDGELTELADAQDFKVVPLERATFPAEDKQEALEFQQKVARLQRGVRGAVKASEEAGTRLAYVRKALLDTPSADRAWLAEIDAVRGRLNEIDSKLRGDRTRSKRNVPAPPSILERVLNVVYDQWYTTSAPTQTHRDAYRYAGEEFTQVLADLRKLISEDLAGLEARLEKAGAPWTPGRLPDWQME
jgi:hypothetical protein